MNRVAERGLTFGEAKHGIVKPGQQRLALFDQTRVEIFWAKHIPAFFAQIPGNWLLAMSDRAAGSKGDIQ